MLSFAAAPVSGYKPATPSSTKTLEASGTRFYFHGTTADDANRLAGSPSATFDANSPTGSSEVTQTGGVNGNANQAANTLSIYWLSTAYTGPINGTVSFDWYWSTAGAATSDTVTVTIYVDVDPANNTGHRIGKANTSIQVGVMPVLNHIEIPNVYGFVNTNLLIQVTTTSADTAHYDSTATPSSFVLPPASPSGWLVVDSPNPPAGQANYLRDVDCTSANDCWAVGFAQNYGTLTEHYDGSAWSIVPSPNVNNGGILFAVSCASANDCWAVGYAANTIFQTLVEHWDGTAWSVVASPNPLASQNNFFNGVTCLSANDCWAVGDYYIGLPGTHHQTLIEHFDGTGWSIVTSANTSSSHENVLYDISCAAANDCWTVGSNDSFGDTLVEHWDGASWSIVPSPNATNNTNYLYKVTCSGSANCWAIGKYYAAGSTNSGAFYDTLVLRYDGTTWTLASSPSPGTWSNDLWGLTCVSSNDCWIVGYYGYPSSGAYPMMFHNTGSGWIPSSPQPQLHQNMPLYGVACASPNDCWAVGNYNDGGCEGCFDKTLIEHYLPNPPTVISAVSRKTHGSGGDFDVDLPLLGNNGIECRTGGANGDHKVVVTFASPVTVSGFPNASLTSGTGTVANTIVSGSTVTIDLTGVTNAQAIMVTLFGVSDGINSGDVNVPMGVLLGDTNADTFVNSADIGETKSRSGQVVDSTNFRSELTVDGNLNSADIGLVKSKSGTALP